MRDFYRTAAGKKFFEQDVPAFINALTQISIQLKELNAKQAKSSKMDEKMKKLQIKESLKGD